MATQTQTVIIDFQADYSSLQDAVDVLEKAGKVDADLAATFRKTNQEIKAQGNAFTKTAADSGKSVQQFSKLDQLLRQFPKTGMNRFLLQVGNELTAAGLKADDFFTKTKKGTTEVVPKITSLRQELKLVRDQMQAAALAGDVLGEEYQRLKIRAGELDDTIKDVANDIANAGSDTRGIDNAVGAISALAGGFSAVQGAAALFGDEQEDVQKALLKVNAAMALATGLQQVLNATTKQGSLTRVADAIATGAQTVAQRIYAVAVGQSIGVMKAFRIALAATGIGLLVVALAALISKLSLGKKKTEDLTKSLQDLAAANAGAITFINRQTEKAIALAAEKGALDSKQLEISLEGKRKEIEANRNLENSQRSLAISRAKNGKIEKEASDAINATFSKGLDLQNDAAIIESKIRKARADEAKERADKAKEEQEKNTALAKEAREKAQEQRLLDFEDFKAGIELKLIAAEKGSEEELKIRQDLLRAQLLIDLEAEKLTANQRKLLVQQYFKDRKELQTNFNKEAIAGALENERLSLAASLENLNLAEEDRLAVKINFLQISAAEEIAAAEGNAAKIRAINAKLNADITAEKIASIQRTAAEELRLSAANGGAAKRALQAVQENEKMKADVRINAANQLEQIDLASIDRLIKANRDAAAVKGADQKTLNIEYAELMDQRLQVTENTEKKITDITKSENEKRQADTIAYIQATTAALQQVGTILADLQANGIAAAEQAIERQRREVDELLEAGAITEKEADRRNKKIEQQEREVKNRAARQQKALAVFNAFLAIPQAYIAGLTAPPPIGGPIYAALLAGLAAASAAAIAARPVPKFATGKKGSYAGPGIVGDAGAELIERADGSMEVATKRQLVYLGAKDKVFTAGETKRILPTVNKEAIAHTTAAKEIDYDKLAAAIRKGARDPKAPDIINDNSEVGKEMVNALVKNEYFNRYYKS